ncbi:2Fe-2S iron-sulfur cluster-binding protein [Arhodomonas sp. AD133]|uniref:2Fe-2S iron-sulfur cluster-binding protein n=1 Tax=Arhodomonas sp. AD133 TaxID=3415009 RepID=UPI003EBED51A
MTDSLTLTIDGHEVTVPPGTTIWEAARDIGIDIPVLCHDPRLRPVGVCRVCAVDTGERTLPASCVRPCEDGMTVQTATDEVIEHRRVLTELLLSEQPEVSRRELTTGDDALYALARAEGITEIPWPDGGSGRRRGEDHSSPVITVDHQACILCDRCIRGCDEIQHNDVITRTGKGYDARIAFDLDTPMGESTCVSCGECVAVCPTGALTHSTLIPRAVGGNEP